MDCPSSGSKTAHRGLDATLKALKKQKTRHKRRLARHTRHLSRHQRSLTRQQIEDLARHKRVRQRMQNAYTAQKVPKKMTITPDQVAAVSLFVFPNCILRLTGYNRLLTRLTENHDVPPDMGGE